MFTNTMSSTNIMALHPTTLQQYRRKRTTTATSIFSRQSHPTTSRRTSPLWGPRPYHQEPEPQRPTQMPWERYPGFCPFVAPSRAATRAARNTRLGATAATQQAAQQAALKAQQARQRALEHTWAPAPTPEFEVEVEVCHWNDGPPPPPPPPDSIFVRARRFCARKISDAFSVVKSACEARRPRLAFWYSEIMLRAKIIAHLATIAYVIHAILSAQSWWPCCFWGAAALGVVMLRKRVARETQPACDWSLF
ncbi:hypothetical protein F5B18DRAFT_84456 [Nemania serpens]|nr:hypothetical protein F5B18DRAFT_84456 [Nemania serpens]